MPFAMTMTSGTTPACSIANIVPVRAEPGLHLVGDEQDPVLATDRREPLQERRRRRDVAALAEHRLEHHRRGLARRGLREQQVVQRGRARARPTPPRSTPSARGAGTARRTRPPAAAEYPARYPCFDVVIAIVRWLRPWKLPENTMTFGRPVACLASFTAASVASAPELAKKNVSMPSGRDAGQPLAELLEQRVAVAVDLRVDELRRPAPGSRRRRADGSARC